MILSNHYIRRRLGFVGLRGFAGIPSVSSLVTDPEVSLAVLGNKYDAVMQQLLSYDPAFGAHWSAAQAVSAEIDTIASEPEAAGVASKDKAAIQAIRDAFATINANAGYYYMKSIAPGVTIPAIDNTKYSSFAGACKTIVNVAASYGKDIAASLIATRDAIAKRQAAVAAKEQQDLDTARANAAQQAAEAEQIRTTAASESAKKRVVEAQNTTLAVRAETEAVRQQARATELKILGLPVSIAAPIGLGAVGLLFLLTRHPAPARAVAGYRRRR